ncbi:MAG: porin [Pseudorhodobacter sp.]
MKKLLIATTALVATAGVAAADVKLSGYGRFGLDYHGDRGTVGVGGPAGAKTQVNMRMRVNIDGSVTTDSGVTFGGRIRMQSSTNSNDATLNAAMLYGSYAGLRMEVGNSNNAFDSAALMYNSEMGYLDRSFGDPIDVGLSYASTPGSANKMGIFARYSFGDGSVRMSYVNPDQRVASHPAGTKNEVSISADYKFGQFTVSGAYGSNLNGTSGHKGYFIGAEYAVNSDVNVGLLHFRDKPANVAQTRTTLYGNFSQGAMTYRGYIARDNLAANATKTAFGLGLDYDLGGARLSADVHRNYAKKTRAGVGVRFDF